MEKRLYGKEDFNIGKWSGGVTTELALYPETAKYLERDFIWRLSSASVDLEESSFTRLPDYDRVLMVLEGEAVLVHGEERTVKLAAMEQDSFGGEVKTKCFGKLKDYNLMVRKGCSGSLQVLDAENASMPVPQRERDENTHCSYGFYCVSGYAVITGGGSSHMVKEGQQLVLDFMPDEHIKMSFMGEGQTIFAEITYVKESYAAEEIPEEKAGVGDFAAAFKLSLTRNKWSQAVKKNKNVWYDEALQKALKKLDRTYITLILWVAGVLAAIIFGAGRMSEVTVVALAVVWTVLVFLLIIPVIYMLVLPKPIRAHIKDVDKLTEYEKRIYLQELDENEMLDKVLRKYRNSGKALGRDEEESK